MSQLASDARRADVPMVVQLERRGGLRGRATACANQVFFFFSSRRRHTRCSRDWSSDVCSSDLLALRDAIAASLGAMLAWELSHYLLGHPKPVFAAVTALVCLAPGLPSHLKQTWGLVLGCAIGIIVGKLAWLLPDTIPLLRLSLASLVALSLAAMLGQPPVVPI